jgi:uncharacterized iron-regulated membrane protein
MQRKLYLIHSWLGLLSGLLIAAISLSGSILVFRAELERWLHPDLFVVAAGVERKSYDVLRETVLRQYPEATLHSLMVPTRADQAAVFHLRDRVTGTRFNVSVNPYSGAILQDWRTTQTVTGWLDALHYSLFMTTFGEALVAVLGATLMIASALGFWLARRAWARRFTLRTRHGKRPLLADVHTHTGWLALLFNLWLGLTGLWMNFGAIQQLISPAHSPPAAEFNGRLSLDAYLQAAARSFDHFQATYLMLPQQVGETVMVQGSVHQERNAFLFFLFGDYHYGIEAHAESGAVLRRLDPMKSSWVEWFDALAFPLHSGWYGGYFIKAFYCLLGMLAALLAVSGYALKVFRIRKA